MFLALIIWCTLFYSASIFGDDSPVARPPIGPVKGKVEKSASGREYYAFWGIPYAKPPIGELRFQSPEPAEPWSTVRDATSEGAMCMQFVQNVMTIPQGEEDCLYINVFTHELDSETNHPNRDVMVWIHGGAFTSGSSSSVMYGPGLLMDKDIVMVSMNYRLAILGFLSTGDEASPGNYGLKDQNMALRWVRDNIGAFGGNPDSVTIFGESAGGGSVHYQYISPLSKGLFHRAIAQSGTATAPWALTTLGPTATKKVAEYLNCPTQKSAELVECLRKADPKDLVMKSQPQEKKIFEPSGFLPVVEPAGEKAFITEHPNVVMEEGKFSPLPIIYGFTADEGSIAVFGFLENPDELKEFNDDYYTYAAANVFSFYNIEDQSKRTEIATKISEFYMDGKPLEYNNESARGMLDAAGDRYFAHGAYRAVQEHVNHNVPSTHLYIFTFKGKSSLMDRLAPHSKIDYGVAHGDDLQYLFTGVVFQPIAKGSPEATVSSHFVDMWTTFARNGDPTEGNKDVKWKPVERNNLQYLEINITPRMHNEQDLPLERMKFWTDLNLTTDHMKHD